MIELTAAVTDEPWVGNKSTIRVWVVVIIATTEYPTEVIVCEQNPELSKRRNSLMNCRIKGTAIFTSDCIAQPYPMVVTEKIHIHTCCNNIRALSIGKSSWSLMLINVLSPSIPTFFSDSCSIDFSNLFLTYWYCRSSSFPTEIVPHIPPRPTPRKHTPMIDSDRDGNVSSKRDESVAVTA